MFNFWGCTTHWKCDTIINRGRCIYLQYFKLKGMQNDALESLSRDVCWTFEICWSDTWFWAFFNNLLNFKVIDNLNYHNFKFTRIKLNNDCVHEHISLMFVLSIFFYKKHMWMNCERQRRGVPLEPLMVYPKGIWLDGVTYIWTVFLNVHSCFIFYVHRK